MDVVSENNDKQTELIYVTNVLLANGYPKQQIEKVKRKISRKVILIPTEEITTEEPKAYVNLPYINGTSIILRRIFNEHNIKSTFTSKETLRKILYYPKDKLSQEKKSNVIYQIRFNDCEAVYIGETKRTLVQRIQEHKRAVRNAGTSKNEIADHSSTKDHQFNWNENKIIDQEKGWITRKIEETIHSINNDKHINSTYYNLADIWLPSGKYIISIQGRVKGVNYRTFDPTNNYKNDFHSIADRPMMTVVTSETSHINKVVHGMIKFTFIWCICG